MADTSTTILPTNEGPQVVEIEHLFQRIETPRPLTEKYTLVLGR